MPSRVLVLGSRGFLGRHVVAALRDDEAFEPVRHVRISDGPADDGAFALDLALATSDDVQQLIDAAEPDAVINCVGRTGGTPPELHAINVALVETLLDALGNRQSVRLVHLGSAAEYGDTGNGIAVPETAVPRPASRYGSTKLAASLLVQTAARMGRVSGVVLRVFNPVGAHAPAAGLPGRLAAELRAAPRLGDGTVNVGSLAAHRDFIDARDVATAALAATGDPSASGAIFNVGRGEAVMCRDLAAMLVEASGRNITLVEDGEQSSRSAAVSWQQADITAITGRFSWRPSHSLEDAVGRLWAAAADASVAVAR